MFEQLTNRFTEIVKNLRGLGKITEKNVEDTLRSVRRTLLEADVNYKVVKNFIESVKEKALGEKVVKSITPGQQLVKIIHDELVGLMGGSSVGEPELSLRNPSVVMIVGLQGSGKTTFCAKYAKRLKKSGKTPLLVAADVQRPAAIEQLKQLASQVGVEVHSQKDDSPIKLSMDAVNYAKENGQDVVIIDTAGRLQIDNQMMDELKQIKERVNPELILFVADGMSGQDAVNAASEFADQVDYNGVVLTKMDGDARGGAALSILAATGKPIYYAGIGESLDALELFHPDRMTGRILGMGDVVTLVEKAQSVIDEESAKKIEEKLLKQTFTLEDFLEQLGSIKKMGPLEDIIGMIPGMGSKLKGINLNDNALTKTEAIIQSMTPEERNNPGILDGSRRKRISTGSGTSVNEVNKVLNQFSQMKKMMKMFGSGKMRKGISIPGPTMFTG
ncbi:MAG: signal recognition particle protein [Candidatus Marinimicrobia bacterium]|nr:signal recognition particle protein [Candidatus Neomarinimicrobiota bacterium]